jgi:uncharacterized protein (TIGR04222 family)
MWPFNLRGPEFLLFYVVAGAIVLTAAYLLRHAGEPADTPRINLTEPYLIAFLRGGKNETLRVITMSLIDRGLLVASANKIVAVDGAFGKTGPGVEQKIVLEQKIVRHFNPSASPASLFKMKEADPEMKRYEDELTRLGLLPDRDQKQARNIRAWTTAAVLLTIGVAKIVIAENTGHHNVAFLIVLTVVFTIVGLGIGLPRQTRAGDRMIEDLRTLFEGLKWKSEKIQNGASPAEFALMAAVFGMATIPYAKTLFPQGGSSCGSGCGSDGGSSSSCGGGGCGGCGGG